MLHRTPTCGQWEGAKDELEDIELGECYSCCPSYKVKKGWESSGHCLASVIIILLLTSPVPFYFISLSWRTHAFLSLGFSPTLCPFWDLVNILNSSFVVLVVVSLCDDVLCCLFIQPDKPLLHVIYVHLLTTNTIRWQIITYLSCLVLWKNRSILIGYTFPMCQHHGNIPSNYQHL